MTLVQWSEDRDFTVRETVRMHVTPYTAELMLKRNRGNRPYRPSRTQHFAQLIKRNSFVNTGQGLIFYTDGRLADGQHRLHAIVQTGVWQELDVTFGVTTRARDWLDLPLRRTRGDLLAQNNEHDYNLLAASLKLTERYLLNSRGGTGGRYGSDQDAMLRFLDRHPDIRDYLRPGRHVYKALTGITPSAATTASFLSGMDPASEVGDEWYRGLIEASDRYPGDPRTLLERQLARAQNRDPIWQVAMYGRAHNAWTTRTTLKNLVWRRNEQVPVFGRVAQLRRIEEEARRNDG